jgi:hypothetical protein
VLLRLHTPRYAHHAHRLFKDRGACILDALLLHGRLKRDAIIRLATQAMIADPDGKCDCLNIAAYLQTDLYTLYNSSVHQLLCVALHCYE